MIEILFLSHSLLGLDDRCLLEVARRLRQDAAFQGGTSLEQNVGLDQEDSLHVRTCVHHGIARDLPEDVLRKCATRQVYARTCDLNQVPSHLYNEDVGGAATEGDVRADGDVRAEGVDAGRQRSGCATVGATESAGSEIDPVGIDVIAPVGVKVRALHVTDRGGQMCRNGCGVVRREGLARDLRGRRELISRVSGQAEASHGGRGDGRDSDVACDGRGGHSVDPTLGEDHVVAGIPEVDSGGQFALSTSDGLGMCRKREDGEENEAASVGKEHRGL
jgi:hypothetical protein